MRWLGVAALALSACAAPAAVGPQAIADPDLMFSWAEAGTPLPAGVVVGMVGRLEADGVRPASGVSVRLRGRVARTDAAGRYAFSGVPAEAVIVQLTEAGFYGVSMSCTLSPVMGVPRVNLLLVPTAALSGQAADAAVVAGVVTDPRGAALPGGSVHLVDSSSRGGQGENAYVTADADGFYTARLTGLARGPLLQGQASLTAFGTTPGGVRVESQGVASFALSSAPTYAVPAGTSAFLPPGPMRRVEGPAGAFRFEAERLPTRRDELWVRLETDQGLWEVPPTALDGSTATVTWPAGCCVNPTRVRLSTFGLSSPLGGTSDLLID